LLIELLEHRRFSSASAALDPRELAIVGTKVFFTADDGIHGRELWVSDGTNAGTTLVRDINLGAADSRATELIALGNQVFFVADDGKTGLELWKSDGTAAGTVLVKDINHGPDFSLPGSLTLIGNTLYFSAMSGSSGRELWKSDGTTAGTVMVKDIFPGIVSSEPSGFTDVDGTIFFSATGSNNAGRELWKTNGTAAGTTMVKDLQPMSSASSAPRQLTNLNGTLVFVANINELWRSDGTAAGTTLLRDIGATPLDVRTFNGKMFFDAGGALWHSDGTAGGTTPDTTLVPGFSGSISADFDVIGSTIFFTSEDFAANRFDLWRSDGTGTVSLVRNIIPNVQDGIEAAARHERRVVGQTLFFTAFDENTGFELYKTNAAGDTRLVRDIFPDKRLGDPPPTNLTNVNGRLFFAANSGNGYELWTSTGTLFGTRRVADVFFDTPTKLTALE
jgi:ELWxxDGT repeat protein